MKITVKEPYVSYLPEGVAISFKTDYMSATQLINELKGSENIILSAKAQRPLRSLRQNAFLWGIIEKVSQEINGERTEDSLMKIYTDILQKANVRRELVAVLPESLNTLKKTFRAVIPTGQTIRAKNEKTGKNADLITVWVYEGSSKFNTKEMSELLDIAIHYAITANVEIDDLKRLYEE